jgi:hypothetical protein
LFKDLNQSEQCREANFVVRGGNAFLQVIEGNGFPAGTNYLSSHRDFDTKELITLTVLPRSCFEKT